MKTTLRALALAALAVISAATGVSAQRSEALQAFIDAPQSVLPLLDHNTRLDMADYFEAGLATPSGNRLDGRSRITLAEPRRLKAELTDASTIELSILPAASGSEPLYLLITTVATPALDSRLQVYSSKWEPLTGRFDAPKLADWISDPARLAEAEATIPFQLVAYSYSPDNSTLTLTDNTAVFLGPDLWQALADVMRPSLAYSWNGKRFNPVKH